MFRNGYRVRFDVLLAGALTVALAGCGDADPRPQETGSNASSPPTAIDDGSVATEDPWGRPAARPRSGDEPEEERNPFPILAFEERSEGLPTSGTWLGYPRLEDLDGDGLDDLVASNREEDGYHVYQAPPGAGRWTKRNDGIPDDMMYGSCAFGDFDGDGRTDLAINAHKDGLRLYLGQEDFSWVRSGEKEIQNLFLLLDVAVGNLNGDEHPDVAAIGHFKGGVSLFVGDGKGGMQRMAESLSVLGPRVFGREIALADFDGDGIDDIFTTSNVGGKVFLTRDAGGESPYWEDVSLGLPNPEIGNSIYGLTVGDFTGDGRLEVAFCAIPSEHEPEDRNSVGLYAWSEDDLRWIQIDRGLPRTEPYRDVKSADFDADGHLDLLLCDVNRGPVIWLGDGKGGFTAKGRLDCTGRARVSIGDVDGDGRPDVALSFSAKSEKADAGLRVFLNRPDAWK